MNPNKLPGQNPGGFKAGVNDFFEFSFNPIEAIAGTNGQDRSWSKVGTIADFGSDIGTNIAGFLTGRDYHSERIDAEHYARSLKQIQQERDWALADLDRKEGREDTQLQRMVADARAAGINPLHLIGGSGSTGYGGEMARGTTSSIASTSAKTSNIIQSIVAALAAIALKKG